MKPTFDDRIEARIRQEGECRIWYGAIGSTGTATLSHKKKSIVVRRYLWVRTHGPLPRTRLVIMSCGNRRCLNVDHMTLSAVNDLPGIFWQNVNPGGADECWIWRGYINTGGYGGLKYAQKQVQAHRVSYEIHHDVALLDEQILMHSCDNPPCVNPAHLSIGSYLANVRDMLDKGRGAHQVAKTAGTKVRRTTSAEEIQQWRVMRAGGASYVTIAKAFGTTDGTVSLRLRTTSPQPAEEK